MVNLGPIMVLQGKVKLCLQDRVHLPASAELLKVWRHHSMQHHLEMTQIFLGEGTCDY